MAKAQAILRVARHELRVLLAERTLWPTVALLLALMTYALWNGVSWVQFEHETINTAAAEEQERFDRIRAQVVRPKSSTQPPVEARLDPANPASFGSSIGARYAVLPPGPLARLAIGQSDLYPYYLKVSTRSRDTFMNNDEIENPLNLLAGRFDLAFVIVFLLPLVILALTFNVLSGEREQGTLALVLSQPVSLSQVAAGKIVARAAVLVGLTLAVSLVGASVAPAETTSSLSGRVGLWCACVALYGALWFALAVAVNALGQSSATNATLLVLAWLVLVVVLPATVNVTARTLYPMPSRVQMIEAIRDSSKEATGKGSQLLARYFEDHPEMTPGGLNKSELDAFNAQAYAVQEEVARRVQPVRDRYDAQLLQQQAFVDRFRFLSPAIVTQEALNEIAGTDLGRYRQFVAQVDRFHSEWQDHFASRSVRRVSMSVDEVDQVPKFVFVEPRLSTVVPGVLSGLLGLAIPTLAIGLLALRRLRTSQSAG